MVYGFGRIDASGQVADRSTIAARGWRGGDRRTVTAKAGVMIAPRDPGGMVTVPSRPYIATPAALRRRRGLRAGDHVLLAASPSPDTLAAYLFTVVDQALLAHARAPGVGRRQCGEREQARRMLQEQPTNRPLPGTAVVTDKGLSGEGTEEFFASDDLQLTLVRPARKDEK